MEWIGFYFAIWLVTGCFILAIIAVFVAVALAANSTKVCPYCRNTISGMASRCYHCSSNVG